MRLLLFYVLCTFFWIVRHINPPLEHTALVNGRWTQGNPNSMRVTPISTLIELPQAEVAPKLPPGLQRTATRSYSIFLFWYGIYQTDMQCALELPTVFRKGRVGHKYMSSSESNKSPIVIFIGETKGNLVKANWLPINDNFDELWKTGLFNATPPAVNYYTDSHLLELTLKIDPQHANLRSNETLDLIFIMSYVRSRGLYYVQLEKKSKPFTGFFEAIYSNSRLPNYWPWIVLSFYDTGCVVKLLRTKEIGPFLAHELKFYNDQSIAWLLQPDVKLPPHLSDCDGNYSVNYMRTAESQLERIGFELDARRCGSLLSYTNVRNISLPNFLHFHMKEGNMDIPVTIWFKCYIRSTGVIAVQLAFGGKYIGLLCITN